MEMRTLRLASLIVCAVATTAGLPAWAQQGPTDIGGHWAEDRIELLVRRNITDLFPDQTFRPDEAMTRADFIKWLVLASGLPVRPSRGATFADVPASHPAAPYVETAVAYGVLPRTPTFAPSESMLRGDAVLLTVTALGYAFEIAGLTARPLPYDDVAVLPTAARGAIGVALTTDPPLLREPLAFSFRPLAAMTRGEAASLLGAFVLANEQGLGLRYTTPVSPGVDLTIEKRGLLRTLPVWRVQIGAFANQENAQRLAGSMGDRGLPVFIDLQDGYYKVRVGSFGTALEATFAKEQLAGEGLSTWVIQTLPDFEALGGPFRTAALVVDSHAGVRLLPAFGTGQRRQRMRTSTIARRLGALAAINGGFFGPNGEPLGCLMVGGEVANEPDPQHTCAGFTADGLALFDRVRLDGAAVTPEGPAPIDGVNRERRADELIVYRPSFDQTTRTNAFGAEAIVSGGVVTERGDLRGNSPIPRDGFVLSGHGRARLWILEALAPGTPVTVRLRFVSSSADARWERVVHAIGGGPRLLAGGAVADEGFTSTLVERRHPRTAMGVLPDGRIVLLVVDGRSPPHSLGMTLLELAMELRRLGAVDAMNLDGGGSSTMVVNGRVVNLPSDETGEREVATALLILSAGPEPVAP
jgi:hypothetical protein